MTGRAEISQASALGSGPTLSWVRCVGQTLMRSHPLSFFPLQLGKKVQKITSVFDVEGLSLRHLWKPGKECAREVRQPHQGVQGGSHTWASDPHLLMWGGGGVLIAYFLFAGMFSTPQSLRAVPSQLSTIAWPPSHA